MLELDPGRPDGRGRGALVSTQSDGLCSKSGLVLCNSDVFALL